MPEQIKAIFWITLYISLWFLLWPAAALWTAVVLVQVANE